MNNKIQTPLDICNLALSKLGEPPISQVTPDGTPAERLCYEFYHPCRREVLCTNRWKFAIREHFSSGYCGSGCIYTHYIPIDALRVFNPDGAAIRFNSRELRSLSPEIQFSYIADEEDVTKFDPLFIEAFATRLAAKICRPLTHSVMKAGVLLNEYNKMNF